ncbi:hypothetical protein P0D75_25150 [Paraburkholderia sediminicola]|uniref:hypothetical protein n=1 Tax=Paraburkholderia sediminicola TaxID=458836 RepID=UPI0038B88435
MATNISDVRNSDCGAFGTSQSGRMGRRALISSVLGHAFEGLDFLAYGYFATTVGREYFPPHDGGLCLLLAVGVFGSTWVMRPFGTAVLSKYVDRNGHKATTSLATALMMLGTFSLAVMPPYEYIGVASPLLILVARLVQRFAVGGDFDDVSTLPKSRSSSWGVCRLTLRLAKSAFAASIAAGLGALLTAYLPPDQLSRWGWRVPFLLCVLAGPAGFYVRVSARAATARRDPC